MSPAGTPPATVPTAGPDYRPAFPQRPGQVGFTRCGAGTQLTVFLGVATDGVRVRAIKYRRKGQRWTGVTLVLPGQVEGPLTAGAEAPWMRAALALPAAREVVVRLARGPDPVEVRG